jgi:predicted transcriptional regulator
LEVLVSQRQRGELEADILNVLWNASEPLTVKAIQEQFNEPMPAITTLITVLERLRVKGSVERQSSAGRSYEYFASFSRVDQANASIQTALDSAGDRAAALMLLAGSLTAKDRDVLAAALAAAETSAKKSKK